MYGSSTTSAMRSSRNRETLSKFRDVALRSLITLWIFVTPIAASAHHSFSLYSDEITELEGELVSTEWRNPHVRFTLRVGADTEHEQIWVLEAGAGYTLERRGLARELFQPGDRIKVAGRLHVRESDLLWLHNLLLGNGQELMMIGGVPPRWTVAPLGGDEVHSVQDTVAQDRGIFRVWSRPVLRPITYGEGLPYRAAPPAGGREWIDRLNEFAERCESVGMPGVMATPYPFEFVDHGTYVQLLGFSNNAPIDRVIWINAGDSPATVADDRMGYSVGRWQSDYVLIVETTRIDWPYFDDSNGILQSDNLVATEVFTLSEDQYRLDYEMVVTDPETFTEPVTVIHNELGSAWGDPCYARVLQRVDLSPQVFRVLPLRPRSRVFCR